MRRSLLIVLFLSFSLFSLSSLPVQAQSTITVNSTADTTATDGNCTLREAITNANNNAGTFTDCVAGSSLDTIQFNIAGAGPHTIAVSSALPTISDPIFIDGLTQAGSSCTVGLMIVLDGTAIPNVDGLSLNNGASGSWIRGLVIQHFYDLSGLPAGIRINNSNNNVIQCNFLGTDPSGSGSQMNVAGITVENGASDNLIGTDGNGTNDANEGNLISGNLYGVMMFGTSTANNTFAGNKIGTMLNGLAGIFFQLGFYIQAGPNNNIIGTNGSNDAFNASERNLISGNGVYGIFMADADDNWIAGNFIGVNITGTAIILNGGAGIWMQNNSSGNIIGTDGNGVSDALEGNIISGNNLDGILIDGTSSNTIVAGNLIGTDITGTVDLGNLDGGIQVDGPNNRIGTNGDSLSDTLERNVISGNSGAGISLTNANAANNWIAGNFIGTNSAGTVSMQNNIGINITSSGTDNIIGTNDNIGSNDAGEGNLISGNTTGGIIITSTGTDHTIAGNFIGTNVTGTSAIANIGFGIGMANSTSNIIGTDGDGLSDAVEGNLISGNTSHGINIVSNSTSNVIAGNLIGTDTSGTTGINNTGAGIFIQTASNRIGTDGNGSSDTLERNIISSNNFNGIVITGAGATSNWIAGNYIGTDITGSFALANVGNFGVNITNNASGTIIGTNGDGNNDGIEGNLISGNDAGGVLLSTTATGTFVAGNLIGTNSAGTGAVPNIGGGIFSQGGNNLIGTNADSTSDALEANVISGNLGSGITFVGASSANNTVAGNIIGLNATATGTLANAGAGITIQNAANNNTIGGALDAQSNIIGGNSQRGIHITGANATNNVINNNYIGTNAAQAVLPNGTNGIEISATGTGTTTVTNNWIFYHPTTGILLSNAADLGAQGVSEQNCIVFNTAGLNNTTGINTFFENNWWGNSTGPSGVGTGSGDSVTANVDYIAFLTIPPTGCPGFAGVTINPLAVSAAEGATTSYTIVLESQPAVGEIVTITVAISGAAAGEVASTVPATLTFDFDSTNWNIPQQFDITLADDLILNGNRNYVAAFTHTSDSTLVTSGYDATAALVIDSVDLDVIDNESPNMIINPTAFNLTVGNNQTYDVSLTVEPASDVTITLTQLDANCTISTTTLTFTNSAGATPWNVPQQVTVTGVGAVGATCAIRHLPTGGGYTGVAALDVIVTLRRGTVPANPTTGGAPAIVVFDPAISKLGILQPGQTGIIGEELEWIVTVSNVSSVAGTNVSITDTLIPALQIDSVNAPGGTVTINGQTVTVTYPTLAVGQTVTFSIFTTVLSGATVENTACVNATNQAVQECVTGLAVRELPSTGESPFWRYALLMGIAVLLGGLATIMLYRKPKSKNQSLS